MQFALNLLSRLTPRSAIGLENRTSVFAGRRSALALFIGAAGLEIHPAICCCECVYICYNTAKYGSLHSNKMRKKVVRRSQGRPQLMFFFYLSLHSFRFNSFPGTLSAHTRDVSRLFAHYFSARARIFFNPTAIRDGRVLHNCFASSASAKGVALRE